MRRAGGSDDVASKNRLDLSCDLFVWLLIRDMLLAGIENSPRRCSFLHVASQRAGLVIDNVCPLGLVRLLMFLQLRCE